jgi:putative hydrolase of the HAD superfamily
VVKGVVFDLFHTLTDLESEFSQLPWTCDILGINRRQWDDLLIEGSRWRLAGEETDPYVILSTLARHADASIPDERIAEALALRIQRFHDALVRVPPANVETIRRLRDSGFRLGLISNADAIEAAAWEHSPLAGLFHAEIFSCHVGCVKPERAIYERCLAVLGLTGDACLFVGDGGSNELVGAKEAGMTTVFVSGVVAELWPDRVAERLAVCDYHVEGIPEVLGLVGL